MRPEEWAALLLSLKVASVAVLISLPLALWVAVLLARRDFRGKVLLATIVHLPLVMPPVVTGYLLLILMGRNGFVGGLLYDWFGITFAFRWTGAALAAAVMGFPLVVRTIRQAVEAVDPKLEEAAATLGAGRVWCFVLVTLPLILPGILAGMVLGFAKALGEFGATITFVANIPGETQTLPLAIYEFLQIPGAESAAVRMVLIAVAVALLAVFLSEWLGRKVAVRIGRG